MKSVLRILLSIGILACGVSVLAATSGQEPYIGCIYPAGGQQGTVFKVVVRGQRLRSIRDIVVSGEGVHASVVSYVPANGLLNQLQQEELKRRLQDIREARTGIRPAPKPKSAPAAASVSPDAPRVSLPDIPELRNLDQLTAQQLQRIASKYLNKSKRPKPPIAEEVTLEVTIDANAAPGNRDLRLKGANGLSNPMVFQIGRIPEACEPDNESLDSTPLKAMQPPVALNGQIMPGEVDRFPLELKAGQRLLVDVEARELIPYLADAVPGWFQAVASIYDSDGKEVAYADDSGYDPDPAFVFQVPRDGQYTLAVRDALYRGREDFVYRVDVIDAASTSSLLPTGSRGGVLVGGRADEAAFAKQAENYFANARVKAPAVKETEPNNAVASATNATFPRVITGCIASVGDKDVFKFSGRAGQQIVAEVYARRMGSALDSLVQLMDSTGKVIASNDDHDDLESGLMTHHADSYLSARLPTAGSYTICVSDAQGHGGAEYAYGLRIGASVPDFALRMTPSCLNIPAGRAAVATVYVVRKDGWNGDIDLALKDAPQGFYISGGRIARGQDKIRVTVTAPRGTAREPVALQIEGSAQIDGKTVTHQAVAADDMMQAFAYHHLVPAQQLLAMPVGAGAASVDLDIDDPGCVRIPSGGTAEVTFSIGRAAGVRRAAANPGVQLELNDPPAGVTLQSVAVSGGKYKLLLKADDKHPGCAGNLIVEAFTEVTSNGKKQPHRVSLGVLPAIPFEIVKR